MHKGDVGGIVLLCFGVGLVGGSRFRRRSSSGGCGRRAPMKVLHLSPNLQRPAADPPQSSMVFFIFNVILIDGEMW